MCDSCFSVGLLCDELQKIAKEREEEILALQKGKCLDCGGGLIKKVFGYFRGKFEYGFPECENCGRRYPYNLNVPKVGEKEFLEDMQKPMTI